MTLLESKIAALLVECENILEPVMFVSQKWVIITGGSKQVKDIRDKKSSLRGSVARAMLEIRSLEAFGIAKQAFERDEVFSKAARAAGYWATLEAVLQYLVSNAGKIRQGRVVIDHAEALRHLKSFRKLLTSNHLEYEASARIFGVTLRSKSLSLPDGVTLYRLNNKELNDRQPHFDRYSFLTWEDQELGNHHAEFQVSITVPVDHSQEGAFFNAQSNAVSVATKLFSKMFQRHHCRL